MKLTVTGALGHIGSQLIRDLPSSFPEVEWVLIDNLSTQRYGSLFNLPRQVTYRFYETDVRRAALDSLSAGSAAVIHLAAMTDAASSTANAALAAHNLSATRAVAQWCAHNRVPLIFPSSTSIYGAHSSTVDEDCPVSNFNPQSPYAATKLEEEYLIRDLGERAGLRFVILRLGTIFGPSPGMQFYTAVNKFCWQAALGQPLSIWRTALTQQRPYLALSDAVRAIGFVVGRSIFDNRVYNVLTLNATVGQVIDVMRQFAPNLQVEWVDHPLMNALSFDVSNERFRHAGFEFRGDLAAGIRDTLDLLVADRRKVP